MFTIYDTTRLEVPSFLSCDNLRHVNNFLFVKTRYMTRRRRYVQDCQTDPRSPDPSQKAKSARCGVMSAVLILCGHVVLFLILDRLRTAGTSVLEDELINGNTKATIVIEKSNFDSSEPISESAWSLLNQSKNSVAINMASVDLQRQLAEAAERVHLYDEALEARTKALQLVNERTSSTTFELIEVTMELAVVLKSLGKFDQALENTQNAKVCLHNCGCVCLFFLQKT